MAPTKKAPVVLTEAELKQQREASFNMRKSFTEANKMFLDDITIKDYDKVGILLSGGVDSTTLLWVMLELGVRPHVYTYTTSMTEKMSTDHKKAQILSDHYNLPLTVIKMPNDPDYVAQTIEHVFSSYLDDWRKTRPDKEVAFLIHEMGQAALKDGMKYLFSGIGEGNVHKLSRKIEIAGRDGRVSKMEVAQAQVSWDTRQCSGFSRMLSDMGIRFVLPHFISNPRGDFSNLTWDQLNRPRKKEATLIAYQKEIELSGINPQVSPMQSGDSGAREYFDTMISTSKHAIKFVGRRMNTSIVYYNALENRYRPDKNDGFGMGTGESDFETKEKYAWAAHVDRGAEIPEEYRSSLSEFIDLDSNEARDPHAAYGADFVVDEDEEESNDDIFGIMDNLGESTDQEDDEENIVTIIAEEDGSYTKKIDCFGYPLYIESSQRECKYAMAGLCSKFDPEAPPKDYKECSSYTGSLAGRSDLLRKLNIPYSIDNGAYERAADWIDAEVERLRSK